MDAIEYLKQKKRMTKKKPTGCCTLHCSECPLFTRNNGMNYECGELETLYPEKAIEIVEQWAQEHPVKTYAQDFFEKFPDAPKGPSGVPKADRCDIYGFESPTCEYNCVVCWNLPMYE